MSEQNKILAKVDNVEIKESDLMYMIERLGPERGNQFLNPQGRAALVNELVNQELLYQDALKKGYDKLPEYEAQVEQLKKDVLKSIAVTKIIEDVRVGEEEAKEYYEQHKEDFNTGESIRASHILVPTEEEAKTVIKLLNEGRPFEELAKDMSTCPSGANGGDLGLFGKGRMVKEFEDAAFNLQINEISDVVKTQFGYHVIKVTEKVENRVLPFEEVKDMIRNNLEAIQRNDAYMNRCNVLRAGHDIQFMNEK